jgi:hypothetical protein
VDQHVRVATERLMGLFAGFCKNKIIRATIRKAEVSFEKHTHTYTNISLKNKYQIYS